MFRIDVPTAAGIIPVPAAPGTPGYFTNGNPGTSTPATIVDQDFLNMIQEELYAIATALGASPSKTVRNQCLTAIQQMIQQQTGNFATDSGAADAYVGVYVPAITAYTNGMVLRLFVANTNLTTTPTFNAGAGAQTILREDGTAIVAGDIPANTFAAFEYRTATTKWYLLSVTQNVAAIAIQQQIGNYATAGGTGNAITATYSPAVGAHLAGMPLRVKLTAGNSGAVTFNPGPGVKSVIAPNGSALISGDLISGAIVTFIYDGTNYQYLQYEPQLATGVETKAGALSTKAVTPAGLIGSLFESAEQTITNSADVNVAHGLTQTPKRLQCWLRCKTAELGYAIGDEYLINPAQDTGVHGVSCYISGANVGFVVSQNSVIIYKRSAIIGDVGNITNGNWRVVLRAASF